MSVRCPSSNCPPSSSNCLWRSLTSVRIRVVMTRPLPSVSGVVISPLHQIRWEYDNTSAGLSPWHND